MKRYLLIFLFSFPLFSHECLTIGSKRFTESYILGEILKKTAEQTDEVQVDYRPCLGSTGIVFEALREGAIDLYPEYTGTILEEFIKMGSLKRADLDTLRKKLYPQGIGVDIAFGFSNSYALAMLEEKARELNIQRISDLALHPELKMGFSQEFLKRRDGWEELKKNYLLPQTRVIGIDYTLSFEGLTSRQIDVTDIYTTDPKIQKEHLRILQDDRHFFPSYEAVVLYRLGVPQKYPETWKALLSLQGRISEEQMIAMNAQVEMHGESINDVASDFLHIKTDTRHTFLEHFLGLHLFDLVKQHLFLVFASLLPAIFVGIFLGILAVYSFSLRHIILSVVGIVQTIPSLALFAFLIPLLREIGTVPALIALFLYALLPIVRNTYTGLTDIPKPLRESAIVLGLPLLPRLRLIELPLASRTILAGIKTAAVINVGMATIAALVGAGGLGEPILTGLALNDYGILLAGAIPACILAIVVQCGFDALDYWLGYKKQV